MANKIEIVSILRKRPANDNGLPDVIPVFVCLLSRPELTRMDVFVYGVIAAAVARGQQPSVQQIARLSGSRNRRYAQRRIAKLEAAGLLRRNVVRGPGRRTGYELLGPLCAAA